MHPITHHHIIPLFSKPKPFLFLFLLLHSNLVHLSLQLLPTSLVMDIQQVQVSNPNENNEKSGGGSGGGNFLCSSRQSSTRWTPTTDQIRILKDLYYNYGVRSPNADQIQRISARLRQYGKIEGKNVFYWFQNHKARERQKKRFVSTDPHATITRGSGGGGSGSGGCWRAVDDSNVHNKYAPNYLSSGFSSASSSSCQGLMSMGQTGSYGYGGSMTVEKNFRDHCSISPSGDGSQNFGWIAMDPYASSCPMFDKRSTFNKIENIIDEVQEEYQEDQEIATLPLFPMRGEDGINNFCNLRHEADRSYYGSGGGSGGWYDDARGSSRASLELSLNSYSGGYPSST